MATRAAVFPTRMALTTWEAKEKGASNGYELLKKKRDALKERFHKLCYALATKKTSTLSQLTEAHRSMDRASWAVADIYRKLTSASKLQPAVRARVVEENVAGVRLPMMRAVRASGGTDCRALLGGLTGGGHEVSVAQRKWQEVAAGIVELAGLQTAFVALDEAMRLTSRRVNALENVLLPRIRATIAYVKSELDEMEREEVYRIKKVLEVKAKHKAVAQAKLKKTLAAIAASEGEGSGSEGSAGTGSRAGAASGAGASAAGGARGSSSRVPGHKPVASAAAASPRATEGSGMLSGGMDSDQSRSEMVLAAAEAADKRRKGRRR